jgi:uncharacterized protein
VSRRGSYAVRISGLADGDHDFLFELDQQFFASFEQPVVENGNVVAEVILEKKPGVLSLHFNISGEVEVICDRCLEPFFARIATDQTIFIKSGNGPGEIEDDVIMIHPDDHEIEVGQLMYEFIVLSLPFRRVHPEDENGDPACNPEMIRKLEEHLGKQEYKDQTDPRWDALKRFIEKKN